MHSSNSKAAAKKTDTQECSDISEAEDSVVPNDEEESECQDAPNVPKMASLDKSDDVDQHPKDSDADDAIVSGKEQQAGSSSIATVPDARPGKMTDKDCAEPLSEKLRPQLKWTNKLTIASWNCGGSSDFKKDVLFMLMYIHKIDVIFIQELKRLKYEEIWNPNKEYRLIANCDSIKRGNEKRGLLILCRKEKVPSFYNDNWERGGICSHVEQVNVPGGNIEMCSVDVLMENGQTRRLINMYHSSTETSNCVYAIEAMLSPLLVENCETLLIGDGNLKSGDKKTAFETAMSKHSMTNRLPKEWDTYISSYPPSQPDILYSSIKNAKNLLVHTPQEPHELLTSMLPNVHMNGEIGNKLQEIRNKNISSPGTSHKVLFAEIGEEINSGTEFNCCPSLKFHCLPEEIECQFIENNLKSLAKASKD